MRFRPLHGLRRRHAGDYFTEMALFRRVTAMFLAATLALSPAVACADFCQGPAENNSGAEYDAVAAGMPEDCAEAMGLVAEKERPAPHDPDCMGCADCPAIVSAKAPALAQNAAASVDAPVLVAINPATSQSAAFRAPVRRHLIPPANGPPPSATPVILKDILRL